MREAAFHPLSAGELQPGEKGSIERPPPGLGRGIFVASPHFVALLAALLALVALAYYARGWRGLLRR